ncbi:DUF2090 domain-containing protein [Salmonella enterica subsp. enterica]|nr:DUF2090 domain-containing protein [Salmonella enterica subsp. enterica]
MLLEVSSCRAMRQTKMSNTLSSRLWNVFHQLGILPDWWKLPPLSPDRWQSASILSIMT